MRAVFFGRDADALISDATEPLPEGTVYVRLGGLDEPGFAERLSAAARLRPQGVVLTGATGAGDVQRLGARLAVEEALLGLPDGAIRILAFVTESPQAIFGLSSYRGASARLTGLVWTEAPLAGALGASGRGREPMRLARNLTLFAARSAGVWAIDAPFDDLDDLEGLRAEAAAAAADGFDGKIALSAAQADVIRAASVPLAPRIVAAEGGAAR